MSKIRTISITNFKAIDQLEVDFKGCTAIIVGGNNKGKTSFIRGIPDRIRGERPDLIVKNGTQKGKGVLTLTTGEKFEWEFDAEGKDKLTFITKEGYKTGVTKEIAKKFFPPVFDIDSFLQSAPKEQSKMLQKLAGIDFTQIELAYKSAYDERTIANRQLKELEGRSFLFDEKLGTDLKDESKLQQEIGSVESHNYRFTEAKQRHGENESRLISLLAEVEQLKEKIKIGKEWISDSSNKPKDEAALQDQLLAVKSFNERVHINIAGKKNLEEQAKRKEVADNADQNVKVIEQQREEMVRSAKLPEGITFSEDGIAVDGFPLEKNQISTSKLYCTALRLASLNLGEVRALHFDASPLDRNSLAEIETWAIENDCQLLIERPDFDGGNIKYELIEGENELVEA